MWALKHRVVVELRVRREAMLTPMFDQAFDRGFCGDLLARPGTAQSTVKTDSGQDIHVLTTANDQIFDNVEAIQLSPTSRHIRKVPTWRRRLATNSTSTIQRTVAIKNSSDRPHRRNMNDPSCYQLATNRFGAVLTEITLGLELLSQAKDPLLDSAFRSTWCRSTASRPRSPVNFVQWLRSRSRNPSLNSGQRNAVLPRDSSRCHSGTDVSNHHTTPRLGRRFLLTGHLVKEPDRNAFLPEY
jgi:hypothetical protein